MQSSVISLYVVSIAKLTLQYATPEYKETLAILKAISVITIIAVIFQGILSLTAYAIVPGGDNGTKKRGAVYGISIVCGVIAVIQPSIQIGYTIVPYLCSMSIISVIVHVFCTAYLFERNPIWGDVANILS